MGQPAKGHGAHAALKTALFAGSLLFSVYLSLKKKKGRAKCPPLLAQGQLVAQLVLGRPAVHERGLHSVPVAGAGSVSGQRGADAVLPLFGRNGREVPAHRELALGGVLRVNLHERVRGLIFAGEGIERGDEAHVLRHALAALVRGHDPLHEREGRVDVFLLGGAVDAPVVLRAGAQALILFAFHADVDREHGQVLSAEGGNVVSLPFYQQNFINATIRLAKNLTLHYTDYDNLKYVKIIK